MKYELTNMVTAGNCGAYEKISDGSIMSLRNTRTHLQTPRYNPQSNKHSQLRLDDGGIGVQFPARCNATFSSI
jgi:hypothetical protein